MNPTMHLISGQLGVGCQHCHTWEQWEREDRPQKPVNMVALPVPAPPAVDEILNKYVRALGGEPERLYFDTQTGLLLRRAVYLPTAAGPSPYEVDFDDYRDGGGEGSRCRS